MTSHRQNVRAPRQRGAKGLVLLLIMVVGVCAMGMSLALLQRSRWPVAEVHPSEVTGIALSRSLPRLVEKWAANALKTSGANRAGGSSLYSLLHISEQLNSKKGESGDRARAGSTFLFFQNLPVAQSAFQNSPQAGALQEKERLIWTHVQGTSRLSFRLHKPRALNDMAEKKERLWIHWRVYSPSLRTHNPISFRSFSKSGVGFLQLEKGVLLFTSVRSL